MLEDTNALFRVDKKHKRGDSVGDFDKLGVNAESLTSIVADGDTLYIADQTLDAIFRSKYSDPIPQFYSIGDKVFSIEV